MKFTTAAGEYMPVSLEEWGFADNDAKCSACADRQRTSRRSLHTCTYMVGIGMFAFLLGALLGRRWSLSPGSGTDAGGFMPRSKQVLFTYNRTFALGPSELTNRAWADLTPVGRGFVRGDTEDSVFGLTVFHQLHCLDMIRHGYYAAASAAMAQADLGSSSFSVRHDHDDHEEEKAEPHSRHCFDYLRQTIQCAADTNTEPVDFTLGGVKGWTNHVCRDFAAVQRMATERRAPDRNKNNPVL